jgi:hypothetical protein
VNTALHLATLGQGIIAEVTETTLAIRLANILISEGTEV